MLSPRSSGGCLDAVVLTGPSLASLAARLIMVMLLLAVWAVLAVELLWRGSFGVFVATDSFGDLWICLAYHI